jgi:hypothetical protein
VSGKSSLATKSTRSKEQTLSSDQLCAKVNRSELQILKDLERRCGGRSFSLCLPEPGT